MKQSLAIFFAVSLCGLTATACVDSSTAISANIDKKIVVIEIYGAITEGGLQADGYINGVGPQSSVHHDLTIAEAALTCGSPVAAVDRSWSHTAYVSFPSASTYNVDGKSELSDFEIVKCIQQRVSIPFQPGITGDGDELVGADTSPFRELDIQ